MTAPSDKAPDGPKFHDSDRGYLDHWCRVGALLETIQRDETRSQGTTPYDWRIVDSLLDLAYEHRDPNRLPTDLIRWQERLSAAYAKRPDLL